MQIINLATYHPDGSPLPPPSGQLLTNPISQYDFLQGFGHNALLEPLPSTQRTIERFGEIKTDHSNFVDHGVARMDTQGISQGSAGIRIGASGHIQDRLNQTTRPQLSNPELNYVEHREPQVVFTPHEEALFRVFLLSLISMLPADNKIAGSLQYLEQNFVRLQRHCEHLESENTRLKSTNTQGSVQGALGINDLLKSPPTTKIGSRRHSSSSSQLSVGALKGASVASYTKRSEVNKQGHTATIAGAAQSTQFFKANEANRTKRNGTQQSLVSGASIANGKQNSQAKGQQKAPIYFGSNKAEPKVLGQTSLPLNASRHSRPEVSGVQSTQSRTQEELALRCAVLESELGEVYKRFESVERLEKSVSELLLENERLRQILGSHRK